MTSDSPCGDREVDAVEDDLPAEGLAQVLDPDLRGRAAGGAVVRDRRASEQQLRQEEVGERIDEAPDTTARVVERPTPSAPPSV